MSRSLLYGADGVVIKFHRILLRLNTTPSARAKDASRRFLDRAATPPRRGGENSPHYHLGNRPLEARVPALFKRRSRLKLLVFEVRDNGDSRAWSIDPGCRGTAADDEHLSNYAEGLRPGFDVQGDCLS